MACSSCSALLFWCREVQQQQRQQPSSISHQFPQVFSSSKGSRSHVRHFFGAILGPVRPSVPCCFGAGRCFWYSSVSSSSSNGSSRLVSLIFCQVFSSSRVSSRLVSLISSLTSSVLVGFQKALFRCDSGACSSFRALLFWCREVLLVLFCQQQQQRQQLLFSISQQFPRVFSSSRVSEVTLGTFSVRFCGLFVLPCLAVLVPGGQQQQQQQQRQQPSSISHQFSLISSLRSSVPVGFQKSR